MAINFDHILLRGLPCEELAHHFQSLLKKHPENEISVRLFDLVRKESVSPQILVVWLNVAGSPKTLVAGLKQDFSVYVRRSAIKQFACRWNGPQWKEFWTAIGAIPGTLSLLEQLSAYEV